MTARLKFVAAHFNVDQLLTKQRLMNICSLSLFWCYLCLDKKLVGSVQFI